MNFILVASVLLLNPVSAAAGCDKKLVAKIEQALDRGSQVLVLGWSEKDKCRDSDEACGDWADRLNTFKDKQRGHVEIFKLAPKQWPRIVTVSIAAIPSQSTLFMMKGQPSYFYGGPILEADVFQAVLDSWSKKDASPNAQFLPQKVTTTFCR